MKKGKPLYIPQGLKLRKEIFNGFGKEEVIKTILVTLAAGLIDILLFFITKNSVHCIIFMLVAIAASVLMLTKDANNISVVDQVEFLLKFTFRQKKYRYKYEIEVEVRDD